MDEMSDRCKNAACASHDYTPSCGRCVARYFLALLDADYVARWQFEDLQRQERVASAMVASLRTQIGDEIKRADMADIRRTHFHTPSANPQECGHSRGELRADQECEIDRANPQASDGE